MPTFPQSLLEHLKQFENHCIQYGNLEGAEILERAQKRLRHLETEVNNNMINRRNYGEFLDFIEETIKKTLEE